MGARVRVCEGGEKEGKNDEKRDGEENRVKAVSTTLTAAGECRSRDFGFPSRLGAV